MEADWQEHYGLDLAAAVYGKGGAGMSARRVCALTLALPRSSRCARAGLGDDAVWTLDRKLLGLVVERLDALHVTTVRAHGGKAQKPPTIVPRPKPARARRRSTADVLADLDAAMAGGGR